MDTSMFIYHGQLSAMQHVYSCPVCGSAIIEVSLQTLAREAHLRWHEELTLAIRIAAGQG